MAIGMADLDVESIHDHLLFKLDFICLREMEPLSDVGQFTRFISLHNLYNIASA